MMNPWWLFMNHDKRSYDCWFGTVLCWRCWCFLIWTCCWIEGLDCVIRCCVGTRGASPPIMVEGIMGVILLLLLLLIIIIIIIIMQLASIRLHHCAPAGSEFSVLYYGCTKIAPRVAGVYHRNVSESTGLEVLRVQLWWTTHLYMLQDQIKLPEQQRSTVPCAIYSMIDFVSCDSDYHLWASMQAKIRQKCTGGHLAWLALLQECQLSTADFTVISGVYTCFFNKHSAGWFTDPLRATTSAWHRLRVAWRLECQLIVNAPKKATWLCFKDWYVFRNPSSVDFSIRFLNWFEDWEQGI